MIIFFDGYVEEFRLANTKQDTTSTYESIVIDRNARLTRFFIGNVSIQKLNLGGYISSAKIENCSIKEVDGANVRLLTNILLIRCEGCCLPNSLSKNETPLTTTSEHDFGASSIISINPAYTFRWPTVHPVTLSFCTAHPLRLSVWIDRSLSKLKITPSTIFDKINYYRHREFYNNGTQP